MSKKITIDITENVGVPADKDTLCYRIADPNMKVISDTEISIKFDYPCDETIFTYKNPDGFTKIALLKCIWKGYDRIYKSSDKYGVWGHDLTDLMIEGIKYNPVKNEVTLDVGS